MSENQNKIAITSHIIIDESNFALIRNICECAIAVVHDIFRMSLQVNTDIITFYRYPYRFSS